jgi:hypothetical protein
MTLACSGGGGPESSSGSVQEASSAAGVSFSQQDKRIEIVVDGRPFTTFHYEEKWDKPFLYPLITASGKVISRGYPIEPREGEEQDHAWHRGIWYGHGDVSGHDFWRELGADKTGKIIPLGEPSTRAEGGKGILTAELGLQSVKGDLVGTLREEFSFARADNNMIIDTAITIRADKGQALKFGDTDDGGLGMRLADAFRQDRGAVLRNSDGLEGTENIWGKPAKWVDYTATVDGVPAGVAMFDHPANPRHPTRWHARGYSLCSANPFALRSFTGDKSSDGSYEIAAGESLALRYRVLIHEGETPPASIEEQYQKFAAN